MSTRKYQVGNEAQVSSYPARQKTFKAPEAHDGMFYSAGQLATRENLCWIVSYVVPLPLL